MEYFYFDFSYFNQIIIKTLVATICGFIIGYDREIKGKTAGIRTNVLMCVGCSIATTISILFSGNIDPTRIIGQIITGIGFIGGGVILKTDDKISGVTTAAFLWVVSILGILIGVGRLFESIILSIGLILISRLLEYVETYIKNGKQ